MSMREETIYHIEDHNVHYSIRITKFEDGGENHVIIKECDMDREFVFTELTASLLLKCLNDLLKPHD